MVTRPSAFGRYLRAKRLAARLTLRKLAARIGVTHVPIVAVEQGARPALARSRWKALEEAIPGFSAAEAERLMATERPLKISVETAPPAYVDVSLAFARRVERRNLSPGEIKGLLRILEGPAHA